MARSCKIPVTIVTGFLGAGKTTFINNLLSKYSNTQFALVENEFGKAAIDTKLIKGINASQMFELKQGCICCTISDEFELVMLEMAERFPDVGHVLIETTGIADPAAVIESFLRDERLNEIYHYNGTICVVDAINFESQPKKEISLRQIVIADVILVNKSENLILKDVFRLDIQKINPFVEIIFTEFGGSDLLELNKIESNTKNQYDFLTLSYSHSGIQTKTISYSVPLIKEDFLHWISYTLDIYKRHIYRVKGILNFQNEPFEYVLQGVGGNFILEEGDLAVEKDFSSIVFIGDLRGINLEFEY